MPDVTTNDGVRLRYEERGEGRPLVLIHDWCFSGRFFVRNIDALEDHIRLMLVVSQAGLGSFFYRVAEPGEL